MVDDSTSNKPPTRATLRRQRLADRGLAAVELHVPEATKQHLKHLEAILQEGAPVAVYPPKHITNALMSSKGLALMTDVENWTVASLYRELTNGEHFDPTAVSLELVEGASPHIVISFIDLDSKAPLLVVGEQILVSMLLLPVDAVGDEAAANRRILEAHKMMPLSTIGITTVNGRDFYEIFGALSARSALASVVTEITMLSENYEDVLAGLIGQEDA